MIGTTTTVMAGCPQLSSWVSLNGGLSSLVVLVSGMAHHKSNIYFEFLDVVILYIIFVASMFQIINSYEAIHIESLLNYITATLPPRSTT